MCESKRSECEVNMFVPWSSCYFTTFLMYATSDLYRRPLRLLWKRMNFSEFFSLKNKLRIWREKVQIQGKSALETKFHSGPNPCLIHYRLDESQHRCIHVFQTWRHSYYLAFLLVGNAVHQSVWKDSRRLFVFVCLNHGRKCKVCMYKAPYGKADAS